MNREEKIAWMALWAAKNSAALSLEGTCGFGRDCVGITADAVGYPDYEWYDDKTWERLDSNGDVWTPPNAYHKHPCVAVLGRGEGPEAELYDWLKWFDDNGFKLETGFNKMERMDLIPIMLGKHRFARMVKQP